MTDPTNTNQAHIDELTELGFPDTVVREVARAQERGLFRIQPPDDLVKQTISECQALLRRVPPSPAQPTLKPALGSAVTGLANYVFAYQKANIGLSAALDGMSQAVGEAGEFTELSYLNRLPANCLATVDFVRKKRQRPLMIVDNHNLFDPTWWDVDSGFIAVRRACRLVNAIARESGAPPIALLMVLRPDVEEYSMQAIASIDNIIRTASSDVWMCPYGKAGKYQAQDLIVFGDDRVVKFGTKVSTPVEAFGAFQEIEDKSIANAVRGDIEQTVSRCIRVRADNALVGWAERIENAEGTRSLLRRVTTEKWEMAK